jgi:8-amino-7-oxononanoate synthase
MFNHELLQRLKNHEAKHLVRTRYAISNKSHNKIQIDDRPFLNFCSNDYLAITNHPTILLAFKKGIDRYGFGSGASPLVSGYSKVHRELEEAFAAFLNREKAILFNSGYHANIGVISALANRNSTIIADKYAHASLIDGAILSRATFYRYQHQNMTQIKTLLKKAAKFNNKHIFLMTESVFSILGTLSDIEHISKLAKAHHATFIVDDAHGIGVLGEHGRGAIEIAALDANDIPCLITPLGKAFGGFGAVVSGNKIMIETILQFARSYCYSTAIPPAICEGMMASLKVISNESWRRQKLKGLILFFIKEAKKRNMALSSYDLTPIKSIIVGTNVDALIVKEKLMQKQLFVSCIREPSVPKNMAAIRLSLNCMHTEEEILYLLDELSLIFKKLSVR